MFTRILLAATVLLATPVMAQPAAPKSETTLIRDVRVFDGERVHKRRSVLIADGRIADAEFKGTPPQGARIVDGRGKTLLPGLIDAHVHTYAGLDDALLLGVTTVIDQFTPPAVTADARARTGAGDNPREADIVSSGFLATAPGGHGTQFGVEVPTLTAPGEADAWVAARIVEGSDFIKIVREPGSTARPRPTLDAATIAALVQAAHKRGKLAVVHVHALADARMAIEAGADGLVHMFRDTRIDSELVALTKKSGAFVSPTYAIIESFAGRGGSAPLLDQPPFAGMLSVDAQANIRSSIESDRIATEGPIVEANIAALHAAGVPILAGSDAPNPGTWFGISLHRELELLVQSGLTPSEALGAATSVPADAYRIAGHGRIAQGAVADLLLVEGDPTREIAATRAIVEVWKDGHSAEPLRAARRTQIAAAVEAAASGTPLALPADGIIARFAATDAGAVEIAAPFGSWAASTDQIMGGKSTAATAWSDESGVVLTGTVQTGGMARWSGIAFTPGTAMMSPADMSGAAALTFRARGSGAGFTVMGFSRTSGQTPVFEPFSVGAEWRDIRVPFSTLEGFDPKTATMLMIGAVEPGEYRLELANIRLVTK